MRPPLIDWIDAKCRTWGYDRRRLGHGVWPQSIAGRADEPIGYGGRAEPIEGLRGDALLVAVAIQRALENRRLPYRQHAVLHLHYDERFRRMPAKDKCQQMGVCRERYYELLGAAHKRIDAHWPTDLDRDIAWLRDGTAHIAVEA